jgi:hypothetical protein
MTSIELFGPVWLSLVEASLKELVEANAAPDFEFSFCEIFTDAPPSVVGYQAGTAGYHYRIAHRGVVISPGIVEDVDVTITVDYSAALPESVTIYTPALLASRQSGDSPAFELKITGDIGKMPPWLRGIHNIMAERVLSMKEGSK